MTNDPEVAGLLMFAGMMTVGIAIVVGVFYGVGVALGAALIAFPLVTIALAKW